MTEVGETAIRVDSLIQEATDFEKLCNCDLDTATSVIDDGKKIKSIKCVYLDARGSVVTTKKKHHCHRPIC